MPLGNDGKWNHARVVSGEEVRERIERRWPIEPLSNGDPHAPATAYRFRDGRGRIGFIDSVTHPFCGDCSRLRLTSDGHFRVCLYDDREVDLRTPMRAGASDAELEQMMVEAVQRKGRGGALDIQENRRAIPLKRTMHQIGG
jgi:cyclic pyranopterin phosphate synthase